MRTPKAARRDEHIQRPSSSTGFEKMCADVYGEIFGTRSAVINGGTGFIQHGRDILIIDWSSLGAGSGSRVWIQCKHTDKERAVASVVEKDIEKAAALVRSDPFYNGVKRFIVAISGPNDGTLRLKIETWNANKGLPFTVELNCWDWICAEARRDNGLWERYNNIHDEGLEAGYKGAAEVLAIQLRQAIAESRFSDARRLVNDWKSGGANSYNDAIRLPSDSWKFHYGLREQLLALYKQAGDMRSAVEILVYDSELPDGDCAHRLLMYLRARRIADNLRRTGSPPVAPPLYRSFGETVKHLSFRFWRAKGSPDTLACLALLVILETDDCELHDNVLELMSDVVTRSVGTPGEALARVAHAVVRFLYVVRHGWTEPSRYYALGDSIDGIGHIGIGDPRLGSRFEHSDDSSVTNLGADPLECPSHWAGEVSTLVSRMCAWYAVEPGDLVELSRECKVYRVHIFPGGDSAQLPSSIGVESPERVTDARTLLRAIYDDRLHETRRRNVLITTELAFERFLGQRTLLQAVCSRAGGKFPRSMLHMTKSLTTWCVFGEPDDRARGEIHVIPVYDNPPERMVIDQPTYAVPVRRTLQEWVREDLIRNKPSDWGGDHPVYQELLRHYSTRDEEFAMACHLALSRGTPMLGFYTEQMNIAVLMGIGWEQPYCRNMLDEASRAP